MKRSLFLVIIILSMLFSLSGSISRVQAVNVFPSLDLDQDGIANSLETSGWYNLAGGPYLTDPNKADSDGDGLTDAEEKLFNTNPKDAASPGIAVKYDSAFKTREYYSTSDPKYVSIVQGGNQYLLKEALVVRRGTTFKIAAVNTGGAVLTISGDGMTAINPVPDPARGGWKVTLPLDGTVGAYTATITGGGLLTPISMPIYVIFELPTGLTPAEINTYLYDDDPANKRDEVAVIWRVKDYKYYHYNNQDSENPPGPDDCRADSQGDCSRDQYHTNYGYAQAFWTEQFTKKVLLDFALPSIQGETKLYDAAQEISYKADDSVRVNYSSILNSFSSATQWYQNPPNAPEHPNEYRMTGGACETNAGVFTSMLRSVGIAARPFNLDYNKTPGHGEWWNSSAYEYDHAVMMWVKGSGDSANRWYAGRISITGEDEWQTTPIWHGGTTPMRPLDQVGMYDPAHPGNQFASFQDRKADLIQTVNAGWDFQDGSMGGGMVNIVWPVPDAEFNNPGQSDPYLNRDYKWDSYRPLRMNYQSPYMGILNCQLWNGDGWAPGEWYDPADPSYYSNPTGRNATTTYWLYQAPDP
ncbi:MAG: transglutaminase domain-containing protein, partial [Anaerolineaceae bacterium]|nr:transglutaminase domain-containing protein [Anaerolineaceae bacterium]